MIILIVAMAFSATATVPSNRRNKQEREDETTYQWLCQGFVNSYNPQPIDLLLPLFSLAQWSPINWWVGATKQLSVYPISYGADVKRVTPLPGFNRSTGSPEAQHAAFWLDGSSVLRYGLPQRQSNVGPTHQPPRVPRHVHLVLWQTGMHTEESGEEA